LLQLHLHPPASLFRHLPPLSWLPVEPLEARTVRQTVHELEPVGVITAPDGAHLIDATGKDYATVVQPPSGLPELKVAQVAVVAAVTVLTQVPEALREEVLSVAADSPSDVRLTLTAGRQARWGSADDTPRKAAVLQVLLTREGTVFDVSSPELPTVS
ncbi:cell division protein FtsQ/DivIB, partial [Actinosynnema sp. NPDC023658]|uniref:cell division protein FtsQ/DivIB n=1 Tax=Actinosynnema sp. NPDC023658 TaxID=3155465 RepID=UPI0033E608C7